jgi:hypothetical protein
MKTATIGSSQHVTGFQPGNRGLVALWTTIFKTITVN